jgi:hypothetical protein
VTFFGNASGGVTDDEQRQEERQVEMLQDDISQGRTYSTRTAVP